MIYHVSRFGYYRMNSGKIQPGWQGHYLGANSPEEAMENALPIMNDDGGFSTTDPAEVTLAKCRHHPRYQIQRVPTGNCGVCHAMWQASKEWVVNNEIERNKWTSMRAIKTETIAAKGWDGDDIIDIVRDLSDTFEADEKVIVVLEADFKRLLAMCPGFE